MQSLGGVSKTFSISQVLGTVYFAVCHIYKTLRSSTRLSFCFVCPRGINISYTQERGGQTFFVGGVGGYDDVDEQKDVSEASKLSAPLHCRSK